ncbi:hypothetical protein [Enterobacter hormaechei]|nr:hypothetical protein [Enterobacter hormaechei]
MVMNGGLFSTSSVKCASFDARLGEDRFCFCRVKRERIVLQRARQADRQEALMNKILAFQQVFGDAS